MNSDPFEHEPLERLFLALERDTETMTPAELRMTSVPADYAQKRRPPPYDGRSKPS